MSHKKKSRSMVIFPVFNRHTEEKNSKENSRKNSFEHSLGENITNVMSPLKSSLKNRSNKDVELITQTFNSPTNSYCTTGSDLEGILDLSTKLSGLSSSSSLSWSEDYELEVTKKVQVELEKLDRAFQGIEDVPPPHDKNEIEEWKHFFPKLCILDEKTPTNSAENSDASSESEDDTLTHINTKIDNTASAISHNKNLLTNKRRTEEQAQNFLNVSSRNYYTLARKPKSLEIEKYLKISSIKSPEAMKRKQFSQPELIRQASKELSGDVSSLDYTSLPFITATSLKTQIRKPHRKNPKVVSLPPIINNFRSISATPRQASSKSMFVSLNFEKNSSARRDQMRLKSDLMKLFDFIPISNR